MKATAQRIAELGYTVLLGDLWGEGKIPAGEDEIGPLIGELASNRELWTGRVRAGHEQLLAQEEVADAPVTAVGYCFGGSSVLEYVRVGGRVDGAVSFHGGLDLVGTDWAAAHTDASVLILTGAEDPMAPQTVVDALQDSMSAARLDWEVASYGATKHGFTNPHADKAGRPDAIAYNVRADRRSWNAFTLFLQEQLEAAGVNG
jgi:dienelactone hydrolase